jgi:hypothetical protein
LASIHGKAGCSAATINSDLTATVAFRGAEGDETEREMTMNLSEYFEHAKGIGVLATTDAAGQVNQALYAKPLFLDPEDEGTCSFLMANHLSHDNVGHNPSAAYLFIEEGKGYRGQRLSLTVMGEETDAEKIKTVRRRTDPPLQEEESRFLVHFHIEGVRPLLSNAPVVTHAMV